MTGTMSNSRAPSVSFPRRYACPMVTLNKSSPRQKPGSSFLISLDFGFLQNDNNGFVQDFPWVK